jgi:hypothetical protein
MVGITMKTVCFRNKKMIKPSFDEWRNIINGKITVYDNKRFLGNKLIGSFISKYLDDFRTDSIKTIAIFELLEFPNREAAWWPKILYFPNGYTLINELLNPLDTDDNYIFVYYRTFHCFDCSTDMDAFCFDRDAYMLNNEELTDAYKRWDYPKIHCPNCNGDIRNPGLIQLVNVSKKLT